MIPVIKALQEDPDIDSIFVNTAQHRDQLDQVLDLFNVKPDYDLDLMKNRPNLEEILSTILVQFSKILDKEKPDLVLVHGDTATTLAGAQTAFFRQIPVGHVEAGLRTFERYSPFPEEMNRQVVGRYASLHFAATELNKSNLLSETVKEEEIFVVGNTVIDALLEVTQKKSELHPDVQKIIDSPYRTILLTTHRRENLEELNHIYKAINELVLEYEDVQIVFPIHKNPTVRKKVHDSLQNHPRIHLLEPQDYYSFSKLMDHSYFIITDSGGIQEEAPALQKPVLVARKSTERIEGVKAGTLKLVGTDTLKILEQSHKLLTDPSYYQSFSKNKNPYGDGTTSKKIVSIIKKHFSN
jgi:UDP-N-acetylglucosamine 2-epimerase (non-hydrolysing)